MTDFNHDTIPLSLEQQQQEHSNNMLAAMRQQLASQCDAQSLLGTTSDVAQLSLVLLHQLNSALRTAHSFEEFKAQGLQALEDLTALTPLLQNSELTINAKPTGSILAEMVERSQAVTTLLKKYQRV